MVISLREQNEQLSVLAEMAIRSKFKILTANPKADISKLPDSSQGLISDRLMALTTSSKLCSVAVHGCLIAAFIFLALFIQDNIGVILTVARHTSH